VPTVLTDSDLKPVWMLYEVMV